MSKQRILFIIILVFLLTRLVVLFTDIDRVFSSEELHQGVVAKEIMEGPDLPLFEYPPSACHGGTFIVALVTVPFFALFGPNLFALKLTPLLFSTVTLIVLFLFAWKFFNKRVAFIMAVLYIFSPPIWGIFNLFNAGFHSENLVFTVLALYIFYEIFFNNKSKPIYYLLLGIISGFGTYFSYTFLVTQAAISLTWFIHDRKLLLKKGLYIFLIGFFLGMVPWFYYNLGAQFKGVMDVSSAFFEGGSYFDIGIWKDIIWRFLKIIWFSQMLGLSISNFGYFFSNLSGNIYSLIYWSSFLYILWYRYNRNSLLKIISSKEFFILIFPVSLLVISAFYPVESGGSYDFMSWRYVVGLFPFVFLTVAIAMDKLFFRVRMLKPITISVFSTLIIFEVVSCLIKINFKDFGNGFNQLGYSYRFLSSSFNDKYPRNFYKILNNITRLSVPEKYEVLTQTLTIHLSKDIYPVDFKEYVKLSFRLDEKYKPFFYKILIKGLYYTSDLSLKDLIQQVKVLSEYVDDKYRPYLYEGIGALMVKRYPEDTAKYKDGAHYVDEKYRAYYYRGLSEPIWLDYIGDYINRCKECLSWLDDLYKPLYLEGIGEVLAKMGVSYIIERLSLDEVDVKIFYHFFKNLESGYKRYVLEGAGKGLSYFYSPNNEKDIYQFINNFTGKDKEIILKTMVSNLEQGYDSGNKKYF